MRVRGVRYCTARQVVGKSFLAIRLYERVIDEKQDVLPAVLCGSEKLARDFEHAIFLSLSRALYDFLVKTRIARRRPEDVNKVVQ
jgi:hypothetical protein